jgi:precorrin-2 dehydrogenase/sirohydrochlorin ferrochelatase
MERNNLYPIFLKTKSLNVLLIGGGNVAEEKLTFLLKSSPDAHVTIVSPMFREGTIALAKKGCVTLIKDRYSKQYLTGKHMVVATTDVPEINVQVWQDCRESAVL